MIYPVRHNGELAGSHGGRLIRCPGSLMNDIERLVRWVVFETAVHVKGRRLTVICEQDEWDAMDPGLRENYVLIKDAIENEGEAERLARSASTVGLKEQQKRSA